MLGVARDAEARAGFDGQLGDQQLVMVGLVSHLNAQPVGRVGDSEGGLAGRSGLPGGSGKGANIGQCCVGTGVFPVLEMAFNRFVRDERNRAGIRVGKLEHA